MLCMCKAVWLAENVEQPIRCLKVSNRTIYSGNFFVGSISLKYYILRSGPE